MKTIESMLETNPQLTPAVVGYLTRGNKVLLGLRKKVSFGLGENLVAGIGGKIEADETADQALVREVEEEIGVTPTTYREVGNVTFLWTNKPKWNQKVTIYLVDEWTGEPQETDAIKPIWVNRNELPESQMWEDNLYWVPMVLEGKQIDATFLYNDEQKIAEHSMIEKPVQTP
jgi:8-oxo-dGTP diphosphatase